MGALADVLTRPVGETDLTGSHTDAQRQMLTATAPASTDAIGWQAWTASAPATGSHDRSGLMGSARLEVVR